MAEVATKSPRVFPNRKVLGLAISLTVGLVIWFMPPLAGLTMTGQHALAVVLMTVLLWVTEAAPTGVAALLLIAVVLCFMPEVPPHVFLGFWNADTMWFILVCFIFSVIMDVSGLGRRLSIYVFSLRNLILIDLGLLAINFVFSVVGLNSAFPKMALLFPLVISFGAMSKMAKDDPYIRHLGIMIAALATNTGLMVYSGFSFNLVLGRLGGFTVNYSTWLLWFFVPSLVFSLVSFVVIYLLFAPPRSEHFDAKIEQEQLKQLGPLTGIEIKTIVWLVGTVVLWATGSVTHIPAGFVAILVAAGMMLPGIGLVTFKQFAENTNWNVVFMLMGILAIGDLGSTGFAQWLWGHILPASLPHNAPLSLMIISVLVEVLHIPLGSLGTSMALAVPSLSAYGQTLGLSKELVSFVTFTTVSGQYFFSYQNAGLIFGAGYGLWKARDIFKYGIAMFIATPLTLGVLLYPWWLHLGWIH
jgi:di/tricarboxylate transporter